MSKKPKLIKIPHDLFYELYFFAQNPKANIGTGADMRVLTRSRTLRAVDEYMYAQEQKAKP